jgi:hypothetical protein
MSDADNDGDGSPSGDGLKEKKGSKQAGLDEDERGESLELADACVKGARAVADLRVTSSERLSDIKEDPLDEGTESSGINQSGDYVAATTARVGPGSSRLKQSSTE